MNRGNGNVSADASPTGSEVIFRPKGLVPTPEQTAIQLARKAHLVIEANAGAAKTTTLALRLAQALQRGADPARVLVLTYTETAVQAFQDALARIGLPAPARRAVQVSTFEAFCTQRLRALEGGDTPTLLAPEQRRPHVLAAIARVQHHLDEPYPEALSIQDSGEASVEGLLASFEYLKGTLLLQTEAFERRLCPALADELGQDYMTLKVFHAYEHIRRGGHPDHPRFRGPQDATYDLASLLLDENAWLGDSDGAGHPLELGLQLVLVDEMHDTNRAMFTVLREVMARNRAGFVGVGDRDQVIHALAGADATFMGEAFDREVAPATRLPLSTSWRFGPRLATAAGRLAHHKPYAAQAARDTEVALLMADSPADQRWQLTQLIRDRAGLPADASLSALAILLRHPHQSVALENLLLDLGVDYRTAGFATYLHRPEVLFVRGLHACARDTLGLIERADVRQMVLRALLTFSGSWVDSGESPTNDPTNDPTELAERAAERARLEAQALAEVARTPQLAPAFLTNQVLRNATPAVRERLEDALDVLDSDDPEQLQRRFLRVLQPQALAARMLVRSQDIAQVSANLEGLMRSASGYDHLTSFFRAMNEREVRLQAMKRQHCLLLSSIEAAKGLEFEHVIVPGLNRGEFATGGDSVDNRNLLYVAMTRARQRLTLMCDRDRPSAYLKDAGLL